MEHAAKSTWSRICMVPFLRRFVTSLHSFVKCELRMARSHGPMVLILILMYSTMAFHQRGQCPMKPLILIGNCCNFSLSHTYCHHNIAPLNYAIHSMHKLGIWPIGTYLQMCMLLHQFHHCCTLDARSIPGEG